MTPDDEPTADAAAPARLPEDPGHPDPGPQPSPEDRVWQGWQHLLADTGGPNTLLWQARTADSPVTPALLDLTTAHPGGLSRLLAGRPTRLSDLAREPSAHADALAKVRAIRAHAERLSAERGMDTCYLGAGVATWEQRGQTPRAPVLLRRCTLRPTDRSETDFVVDASAQVELNPALAQLLRSTAGVAVDAEAIAGLASHGPGFDPYPAYTVVGRLGRDLPGFAVTQRLAVGTFPHGKLAMVSDVAALAASDAERGAAGMLASSLAGEGQVAVPDIRPPADADPDPDPAREPLVLDADADQAHVVRTVLGGQGLVVDAPPHTGATQTIAALVAALAGSGASVLLVSQRRRDLLEVRERLDGVGLADVVQLAGDEAPAYLDQLADLADASRDVPPLGDVPRPKGRRSAEGARGPERQSASVEDRLREHRSALREHVESLHRRRAPWQVTAFEAQRAVLDLQSCDPPPTSSVRLDSAALSRLTRERVDDLAGRLEAAVEAGAWAPGAGADPWFGARVLTDQDVARATAAVGRLISPAFDVAARTLESVLRESSMPEATSVSDWVGAVDTMTGVSETLEVFRPEIFDVPLDEHVAATARRGDRDGQDRVGWLSAGRVRRHARSLLRPGRPPEDLHAELVRAREQREAWQALVGAGARPEISPRLDEAQDALAAIDADLRWLESVLATTPEGGDLCAVPFERLHERLTALAERRDRLRVLPQALPVLDALAEAGMGKVVEDFAARGVPADQVRNELNHIWWGSITREVAASDSGYGRFDGTGLRKSATAFVQADEAHLAARAAAVRQVVAGRRRDAVAAGPPAADRLRALAATRGGLRSAWQDSAELLHALAPCWAVSPYLVADLLPPETHFDVVVVDNASQLTTAAAVSALSRADVVVAFGDEKQAPPTAFVVGAVDAEGAAADGSLFADLAGCLPSWPLRWVHGVVDERVPAFANQRVYGGELVTVPTPGTDPAVTLLLVDGRAPVESGSQAAIESTDAEVEAVVSLVLEHARSSPERTLAVVALNAAHARRIESALADARASLSPDTDGPVLTFLSSLSGGDGSSGVRAAEPFVVVDLAGAAVGGYDTVVLSVGYGKTTHGGVLHRFPALATPQALRQLTSALTQARRELVVVSSMAGTDLDPDRLEPAGLLVRDLLLELAGLGTSGGRGGDGGQAASPDPASVDSLMADLARRLRREGLVVDESVGVGRRRVDLAVRDPHADEPDAAPYLVAIEGDGEAYAALRGSRARDRLWPQAVERLGWHHTRVWSTDLFRDPAREVSRIVGVVREASGGAPAPRPGGPAVPPSGEPAEPGPGGAASPLPGEPDEGEQADPATAHDEVPASSGPAAAEAQAAKTDERKGRRRVPDQTTDDTDAGWGERVDPGAHDRWLQQERPPHWE